MRFKKKKLIKNKVLFLVFLLVLTLSVGKIIMANVLATSGNQLGKLEAEIVQLKKENQKIKEELAVLSSLSRISSEAEKLGFEETEFIVFVKEEVPVALR